MDEKTKKVCFPDGYAPPLAAYEAEVRCVCTSVSCWICGSTLASCGRLCVAAVSLELIMKLLKRRPGTVLAVETAGHQDCRDGM